MRLTSIIVCILLLRSWLGCWTPEKWFEEPKSNRAVHYDIKGVLDWPKKLFEGRMKLTWRNTGTSPTQELPFHLYLNAFRHNEKTSANAQGYCEIKSVSLNGNSLSGHMGEDETVYCVRFPDAVKPGESVQLEMGWEIKFPEIQAGNGWTGSYLVASMWYPKIGVYTGNQWVCEPFPGNAALQGNFGSFDVELSLPNRLQLANTGTVITPLNESGEPLRDKLGRIVEAAYDPDRKLNFIYRLHAEDVQDFSWIVTPRGGWRLARLDFRNSHVFFYCIPKNGSQFERLKESVRSALRYSEERFGTYPYPILSVVELPHEAHSAGAVDMPTIAVISNIVFDPLQQRVVPEQAAIRQIGNQFFKGIVSGVSDKNELGAGLSTWFTANVIERDYSGLIPGKRFRMDPDFTARYGNWPLSLNCLKSSRSYVLRNLTANSRNPASVLAIQQLEVLVGRPVMEDIIRAYVTEKSFTHTKHDDFLQIAESVSGRNLSTFWKNYVETSGVLEYRIQSVSRTSGTQGAITIERTGSITAPITLWVRLDDGSEHRRIWDGQGQQITFNFNSPISEAALDPDRNYPSLKNRLRSTYSAKPSRRGLHYWAQHVFGAIGGFLQGIGLG